MLKKRVKEEITLLPTHLRAHAQPVDSYSQRNLAESEKMLAQVETEILERTLLQCDNPDGVSD